MSTVAFHTLGCKVNHYETEAIDAVSISVLIIILLVLIVAYIIGTIITMIRFMAFR